MHLLHAGMDADSKAILHKCREG